MKKILAYLICISLFIQTGIVQVYADDFDFVIDNESNRGFLVSTRDYTSVNDKIYSFSEPPYFTIVKGSVVDNYNNPLSNATIIVNENGSSVYAIKTNGDGNYLAYLKNNHNYTMEISKSNYISKQKDFFTQSNKVFYFYLHSILNKCKLRKIRGQDSRLPSISAINR